MISNTISSKITRKRTLNDQRIKGEGLTDPGFVFLLVVIIVTVMMVVLFYLWSHLEIVNLGYNISQENSRRVELLKVNKALRLEVANLKSPERIERIAGKRLGLLYPLERQVIVIR